MWEKEIEDCKRLIGCNKRALDNFNEALKIEPNFKRCLDNKDKSIANIALSGKGVALKELGRYEEAIKCFEKDVGEEAEDGR